jgi:membrane protein DedA with SNARE-associated domain
LIAYLIGRKLGRPFLARYGKYVGLGADDLCRADRWFAKWGNYGVFIGHSLPGIRSIISFPAGIARMDVRSFALATFLGALVWNTVLAIAGYALGKYWIELSQSLDGWDIVILAVAGAALVAYVLYGRRKGREHPKCEDDPVD